MLTDQEIQIKTDKYRQGAFDFQQRRHSDWKENYELYRDKVITNRLTQRQTVNVPIMKETLMTVLGETDDAPDLFFKERSNDKQKEIYKNAYWEDHVDKDRLDLKDIVDKKQTYLYGRSFKKFNIAFGRITSTVEDPHDILIDRYCDPTDLNTAKYIGHIHIYRSLAELAENKNYREQGISNLKNFYATAEGVVDSGENRQALIERNERMQDMGDITVQNPEVGETIVEVREQYVKLWSGKEFEWHVLITGGSEILLFDTCKNIIEINDHPFISWASDVERTDLWSDGIADIVRTPNKVLNAWISQLVENRTLRNFGMNYYDSTAADNFVPQTFQPAPWGWYPVPGDPNKIVKRIEIPDLSESLNEMTFLIQMIERASGATATEKGVSEKGQITLGEVQILAQKVMKRINALAKFYRRSWKEYGQKWDALTEANWKKLGMVKLAKQSYKGNVFEKEVHPADWKSESGYLCKVTTGAEQEQEDISGLEKLNAVATGYPENAPLQKILLKKKLDLAKLDPEEQKEVLEYEEKVQQARAAMAEKAQSEAQGGQPAPPEAAGMGVPQMQLQPAMINANQ